MATSLDYKISSLRHTRTCRNLISNYHLIAEPAIKQDILKNTLYIGGYLLECIYTYSICEIIGFDQTRNVRRIDSDVYSVSYARRAGRNCVITEHDLEMKADFIRQYGGVNVDLVPILGTSTPVPANLMVLYNSWKPEFRYRCPHNLAFIEVEQFVGVLCSVRENILNHISP